MKNSIIRILFGGFETTYFQFIPTLQPTEMKCLFFIFLIKAFMLCITMQLGILTRMIPQITTIIYHHMKKLLKKRKYKIYLKWNVLKSQNLYVGLKCSRDWYATASCNKPLILLQTNQHTSCNRGDGRCSWLVHESLALNFWWSWYNLPLLYLHIHTKSSSDIMQ